MGFQVLKEVDEATEGLAYILSPADQLTLIQLAFRANEEAECWPSVHTIGNRTGLSRRAVQKSLRRLTHLRLIEPLENTHGGRPGASTKYLVRLDTLAKLIWGIKRLRQFGIALHRRSKYARADKTGEVIAPTGELGTQDGRTECAPRAN